MSIHKRQLVAERVENTLWNWHDLKAQDLLETMGWTPPHLNGKVRRATEHMQRSRVPSTPSIIVNGRYLVRGNTYADMLRITNYLIEKEHEG